MTILQRISRRSEQAHSVALRCYRYSQLGTPIGSIAFLVKKSPASVIKMIEAIKKEKAGSHDPL